MYCPATAARAKFDQWEFIGTVRCLPFSGASLSGRTGQARAII